MAGRPPKPTALKLVSGNPGKRSLNKQEPDPTYLQDLTAPNWLDPAATAVWNEIAPKLSRAKLLTEVDVQLLAMGCVAVAQYRQAAGRASAQLVTGGEKPIPDAPAIDNAGAEAEGKPDVAGKVKGEAINPWLVVQSMSFKQALAVFREFGMSPAARTRISLQPQGDLFSNDQKTPGAAYFT
jgi:P27 family predicted phage terminase small subunit